MGKGAPDIRYRDQSRSRLLPVPINIAENGNPRSALPFPIRSQHNNDQLFLLSLFSHLLPSHPISYYQATSSFQIAPNQSTSNIIQKSLSMNAPSRGVQTGNPR